MENNSPLKEVTNLISPDTLRKPKEFIYAPSFEGAGIVEDIPPIKADSSPNCNPLSYGEKLSECSFTSTISQKTSDSSFRSAVSRLKTADDTDTTADFESAGEEEYSDLDISRFPPEYTTNSDLWFQSLEYYNGNVTPSIITGEGKELVEEVSLSPVSVTRSYDDFIDVTLRNNSDESTPKHALDKSNSIPVNELSEISSFGSSTPIKSLSCTVVDVGESNKESSDVLLNSISKDNCDKQQTCAKTHSVENSLEPVIKNDILNRIECKTREEKLIDKTIENCESVKSGEVVNVLSINNDVENGRPLIVEQSEPSRDVVTGNVESSSFSETSDTHQYSNNNENQLVNHDFDDLIGRLSELHIKNDSLNVIIDDQIHTENLNENVLIDSGIVTLNGDILNDYKHNSVNISSHENSLIHSNSLNVSENKKVENILLKDSCFNETRSNNNSIINPPSSSEVFEPKDPDSTNGEDKSTSCLTDGYLAIDESFNDNENKIVPEINIHHLSADSTFVKSENILDGTKIISDTSINSNESKNEVNSAQFEVKYDLSETNRIVNEVSFCNKTSENNTIEENSTLLVKETKLSLDVETEFKSGISDIVHSVENTFEENKLHICNGNVGEAINKELESVIVAEEIVAIETSSNGDIFNNIEPLQIPNADSQDVELISLDPNFQLTGIDTVETISGDLSKCVVSEVDETPLIPDISLSSSAVVSDKELIESKTGIAHDKKLVEYIDPFEKVVNDEVKVDKIDQTIKETTSESEYVVEDVKFDTLLLTDSFNLDIKSENNVGLNLLELLEEPLKKDFLPFCESINYSKNDTFSLEPQNCQDEIVENVIQSDFDRTNVYSENDLIDKEKQEINTSFKQCATLDLIDVSSGISEQTTIKGNHDLEKNFNLISYDFEESKNVVYSNNDILGAVGNKVHNLETSDIEDSSSQFNDVRTPDRSETSLDKMENTVKELNDFKIEAGGIEVEKETVQIFREKTTIEYDETFVSTCTDSTGYQTRNIGMDSLLGNLDRLNINDTYNAPLTMDKEQVCVSSSGIEDDGDNISDISSNGSPPDLFNNMTEEEMVDLLSTPQYCKGDTRADLLELNFNAKYEDYLHPESLPDMKPNLDLNTTEAGPVTASDDMQAGELNQVISDSDMDIASLKRRVEESDERNQSLLNHFDPLSDIPINPKDNLHNDSLFGNLRVRGEEVEITPMKDHHIGLLVPVTPLPESHNDQGPGASVPDGGECFTPVAPSKLNVKKLTELVRSPMQEALAKELTKLQEAMLERQRVHEARLMELKLKVDETEKKREMKLARLRELEVKQPRHAHVRLDKLTADNAALKETSASLNKRRNELYGVLEEYEKAMPKLLNQREGKKNVIVDEVRALLSERNTGHQHVANMETALNDIHQKYERSIKSIEEYKLNQDRKVEVLRDRCNQIETSKERYLKLLTHAAQRVENMNNDRNALLRSHEAEVARAKAMIQQKELKIRSNHVTVEQKQKELREMTKIYEELLSKLN